MITFYDLQKLIQKLSEKEEALHFGLEGLNVIETTDMLKAYKMHVLYSLYNYGDKRLVVADEEVIQSWKEFFDTGTNW